MIPNASAHLAYINRCNIQLPQAIIGFELTLCHADQLIINNNNILFILIKLVRATVHIRMLAEGGAGHGHFLGRYHSAGTGCG